MAIFRKNPILEPKPFKCICENMKADGINMHNTEYKSADYRGFALREYYGTWHLELSDDTDQRVEIFYCPFCGRGLNNSNWAHKRRREDFEKYVK